MSDIDNKKIRKRVSDELNVRVKEFGKAVQDINRYFKFLGLGTAVWCPEKIHVANIGGLEAESYVGYSRVEGKWGLNIRTIERDHETRAFVGQRVYTIESSGNMELVVNALRKIPELLVSIDSLIDRQIKVLEEAGDFEKLRDAGNLA